MEFLKEFHRKTPVLIATIDENGNYTGKGFDDWDEVSRHIQENGDKNLYFSTNPVREIPESGKAKKTDIATVDYLHVDIDPDIPEDCNDVSEFIEEFKEEQIAKLRASDPPPTYIIDSGGGVQAFWKLEQPYFVQPQNIDEIELYNRQLSITFGGDKCHNIDRIMRVPFTLNIPNEKKRAKGRVKTPTKLIEANDNVYHLNEFIKAPVTGKANTVHNVEISGNLPELEPHEIRLNDEKYLEVILTGNAVENPYKTRSEALMALIVAMLRVGHTDDEIAAICLNKANKVSDSIYEKPRPQEYLEKQISRGKQFCIDPKLLEFNDKYCVVMDTGKTVIFHEHYDHDLKRDSIERIDFTNFKQFYCNEFVQRGDESVPAGRWWLEHRDRRTYMGTTFSPNREEKHLYNMWRGFAYEPIPNDWSLFKNHILNVICRGNEEHYQYLLNWMARCVQHPDMRAEVAVVLRGRKGIGKGKFISLFGQLFGTHFLQITNPKHLVGNFNAHLENTCLLFVDEGFWAGDKQGESVLKGIITEDRYMLERKGVDSKQKSNHLSIIIASNNDWVVPATEGERRFFVLDTADTMKGDFNYFGAIDEQMYEKGGMEGMLYDLRKMDIKDFNFRKVPETEGLKDQKLLSMDAEFKWWYELLSNGLILGDSWEVPHPIHGIRDDYVYTSGKRGITRKAGEMELAKFFNKVCPSMRKARYTSGEYGKCIHYIFPPLEQSREEFCKFMGFDIEWEEIEEFNEAVI